MLKISLKQFKKFESKEVKVSLGIALGAFLAVKIFSLLYPLFLDNYPYFQPDSFSWISEGFYYAGLGTNYVVRNPAYPLLIAILQKLNLLFILPVFGYLAFLVFLYSSFEILKSFNLSKKISLITIFLFGISWFLNLFATSILSDMYAVTFINLSLMFFIKAKKDSRFLILCSICLAISLNFQYAAFVVVPVYGLLLLVNKKKDLFLDKNSYLAAFSFALLIVPWFIYRYIKFDDPFYTKVQQFELLNLHFDGIPYYIYSTFVILGIPVALITILGLIKFLLQKKYNFEKSLYFLYAFAFFIFWILLYDWLEIRFLLYFVPFIILAAGYGLEAILKNLKGTLSKMLMFIFLSLAVFYIAYLPTKNSSALTIMPGLVYQPSSYQDKQERLQINYLKGDIVKHPVYPKQIEVFGSFFDKKNYLFDHVNKDFSLISQKCINCNICVSPESLVNRYIYQNILSITLEKKIAECKPNNYYLMDKKIDKKLGTPKYIKLETERYFIYLPD